MVISILLVLEFQIGLGSFMQTVILAGGYGTRISEFTKENPKPLIPIGDEPILWHVMKYFSHFGYKKFILCLGYKGEMIKDYFYHYSLRKSCLTLHLGPQPIYQYHNYNGEPWEITLIDTGLHTATGGRVKRIKPYLKEHPFFLTYSDGLHNVNLQEMISFHQHHHKKMTAMVVPYQERFGLISINEHNDVLSFHEKPQNPFQWINGGLYISDPRLLDYIKDDETIFEREPMEALTKKGELKAYLHRGFWQAMDTLKDYHSLQEYWNTPHPPWKVWKEDAQPPLLEK